MSKYGDVAVLAVSLVKERRMSPPDAWAEAAARIFPDSESLRTKGCPKGAFLGLAAAGLINGVPASDYGRSSTGKNAQYAVTASELLMQNPELTNRGPKNLWLNCLRKIGVDTEKQHNSQMDIVLRLYSLGFLGNGFDNLDRSFPRSHV